MKLRNGVKDVVLGQNRKRPTRWVRMVKPSGWWLVLQQHYLSRFNYGLYLVAFFRFISSALRRVITLSTMLLPTRTVHMGHYTAQLNLYLPDLKLISRGECQKRKYSAEGWERFKSYITDWRGCSPLPPTFTMANHAFLKSDAGSPTLPACLLLKAG